MVALAVLYQRKPVNAFCWRKKKNFISLLAAAMKFSKHFIFWRLTTEIRKQTWAEHRDGHVGRG
jgi:hypothetical protein